MDRRWIVTALLGTAAVLWSAYDLTSTARTCQETPGAALADGAEGLLAGGLHLDVPRICCSGSTAAGLSSPWRRLTG